MKERTRKWGVMKEVVTTLGKRAESLLTTYLVGDLRSPDKFGKTSMVAS